MANAWMVKPLPIVAATSPTVDAGHLAAYVGNDYAGVTWRASAASARSIEIDLGSNQTFDTVMAFGLASRSSGGTTVNVYTKVDGGSTFDLRLAAEPLFAGSAPMTSGLGCGLYAFTGAVSARYVLIEFPSAMDGVLEVSRFVINQRIQLQRNFGYDAGFGVRDLGSLDFSRRGVLLRSRGARLRTCQLTFSNINKDEVEATTKPLLEQLGNTEMIALVTDPSADAQRQNNMYFGPLVGDLGHTWRKAKLFEAKINLVSIF